MPFSHFLPIQLDSYHFASSSSNKVAALTTRQDVDDASAAGVNVRGNAARYGSSEVFLCHHFY